EQQVMLELHYWEELSPTQLAEIFEVPPSTMRTRLHRARAALRQAMSALADVPEADLASDKGLDTWARSMRLKRSPSDRDSGSDGSP
ncbi:MAG: sigma-70 family RNA polymerase sigma factor, partial [Myxococcota bacterium]